MAETQYLRSVHSRHQLVCWRRFRVRPLHSVPCRLHEERHVLSHRGQYHVHELHCRSVLCNCKFIDLRYLSDGDRLFGFHHLRPEHVRLRFLVRMELNNGGLHSRSLCGRQHLLGHGLRAVLGVLVKYVLRGGHLPLLGLLGYGQHCVQYLRVRKFVGRRGCFFVHVLCNVPCRHLQERFVLPDGGHHGLHKLRCRHVL